MKTKKVLLKFLTVAVAALFAGCASPGYKQADKTGQGIAEFRQVVLTAKQSVDGALANLDQISEKAAVDPRAAYEAYSKSLAKVESARAKAKSRAADIKAQGAAYFKQWETQLASINNPEIRQMAEERKAQLNATFAKVGPLLEQAKADFDPNGA